MSDIDFDNLTMEEKFSIAEDILFFYGCSLKDHIDFRRWRPEEIKLIQELKDLRDESIFESWYID